MQLGTIIHYPSLFPSCGPRPLIHCVHWKQKINYIIRITKLYLNWIGCRFWFTTCVMKSVNTRAEGARNFLTFHIKWKLLCHLTRKLIHLSSLEIFKHIARFLKICSTNNFWPSAMFFPFPALRYMICCPPLNPEEN